MSDAPLPDAIRGVVGLLALLACQLAGTVLVRLAGLPLPGPVVGMALLLVVLWGRGAVPRPVGEVAGVLLRHLSLLFVPAGVGILAHAGLLRAEALPLVAGLVGSTLLTLGVTALVFRLASGGGGAARAGGDAGP